MNVQAVITKTASYNILIRRWAIHLHILTQTNKERILDIQCTMDVSENLQPQCKIQTMNI